MTSRLPGESGFTLAELIVTMAVMGVTLGVASVAILERNTGSAETARCGARASAEHAAAIDSAVALVRWPDSAHVRAPTLFLPDGRIVGEPCQLTEQREVTS